MVIDVSLACEICAEAFDENQRKPVFLPCCHTFCSECLDKEKQDKTIICPDCGEVIPLQGNGVDALPVNDIIKGRVEFKEMKNEFEAGKHIQCGLCTTEEAAAAWCVHCAELICQFHREDHKRSKLFAGHDVHPLDELFRAGSSVRVLSKLCHKCKKHGEGRKYFCKKHLEAICDVCRNVDHHTCEVTTLDDKANQNKEVLEDLSVKAGRDLDESTSMSNLLQGAIGQTTEDGNALKEAIAARGAALIEKTQKDVKNLQQRVDELVGERKGILKAEQDTWKAKISTLGAIMQNTKCLQDSNAPEIVDQFPTIENRYHEYDATKQVEFDKAKQKLEEQKQWKLQFAYSEDDWQVGDMFLEKKGQKELVVTSDSIAEVVLFPGKNNDIIGKVVAKTDKGTFNVPYDDISVLNIDKDQVAHLEPVDDEPSLFKISPSWPEKYQLPMRIEAKIHGTRIRINSVAFQYQELKVLKHAASNDLQNFRSMLCELPVSLEMEMDEVKESKRVAMFYGYDFVKYKRTNDDKLHVGWWVEDFTGKNYWCGRWPWLLNHKMCNKFVLGSWKGEKWFTFDMLWKTLCDPNEGYMRHGKLTIMCVRM